MIREVIVLEEAARDIEAGIDFYEAADPGVGLYFRDNIIADIRRLAHYFGEHAVHFGFHRALSARFPYAIYYRDDGSTRMVAAVLDLRRNPAWIREQLSERSDSGAGGS
ncbi:MAG: type II toxin-antitoxin system RelE/ParE family toxin [Planctomycetota bacterium]|jgi:plasmid stabilization system protein ParE